MPAQETVSILQDTRIIFPTKSESFDPTAPQKFWELPQSTWPTGKQPTDIFQYPSINQMTAVIEQNSMTYAAAAVSNIFPVPAQGFTGTYNQAMVPIPVDLSLLPAGTQIIVNPMAIFNQLPLIVPAPAIIPPTVSTTTEDPNILQILTMLSAIKNGLNSLLVFFGKAQV